MNIGIIHLNDYESVNKISKETGFKLLDSFVDDVKWTIDNTVYKKYNEKIEFLRQNSGYVFDIDIGDEIDFKHIFNLENVIFYKVLNQTENRYLSISDKVYTDQKIKKIKNKDQIIFTSGRCGTHLLKSLLKDECNYIHHNLEETDSPLNYHEIFTVIRKTFLDTATSLIIGKQIPLSKAVATKENIQELQQYFKNFKSIGIKINDIESCFESLLYFSDRLVEIKYLSNASVYKIFFENLLHYKDKSNYLKNPYDKKTIISNYNEIKKQSEIYQQYYNRILDGIEKNIPDLPREFLK